MKMLLYRATAPATLCLLLLLVTSARASSVSRKLQPDDYHQPGSSEEEHRSNYDGRLWRQPVNEHHPNTKSYPSPTLELPSQIARHRHSSYINSTESYQEAFRGAVAQSSHRRRSGRNVRHRRSRLLNYRRNRQHAERSGRHARRNRSHTRAPSITRHSNRYPRNHGSRYQSYIPQNNVNIRKASHFINNHQISSTNLFNISQHIGNYIHSHRHPSAHHQRRSHNYHFPQYNNVRHPPIPSQRRANQSRGHPHHSSVRQQFEPRHRSNYGYSGHSVAHAPSASQHRNQIDVHSTQQKQHVDSIAGGRHNSTVHELPEQVTDRPHVEPDSEEDQHQSSLRGSEDLRVGRGLNIFSRYGFLTLTVKVRPPVRHENFLFVERTAEVFQRNSYWGKREARRHRGNYDDHFYIHFCENLNELLVAYFDHFIIEGIAKPHKAFTSSLSVRDLARQFGVNASFLNGHFSFVLVRLFRRKRRSTLQGPQEMVPSLARALQGIRVGSTESVHQFVDSYGSHVITEYEVGDMMYQTFVFGDRIYNEIKNNFARFKSENYLDELQVYFTPSYAASVGNVLLASGNEVLDAMLESSGVSPELLIYPNIFRVFENPAIEAELEKLDGEVILSLKLDKITSRLPRTIETRWISDVLDNTLAMYYHHMSSTRKNS